MSGANLIGHGVCPLCSNAKAKFTVSIKKLCCMTCNACNCQIFSRSDSSDEKLRAFIRTAPATPAASTPSAAPAAPARTYEPEPAKPASEPEPATPPAPKKSAGWGFLGALNG